MTSWPGKPRPRTAGPWLRDGKVQAQWVPRVGGNVPSVGGGKNRAMLGFGDRREEAYRAYVDRISNAWRTHRGWT
jgi:hypothetical protein